MKTIAIANHKGGVGKTATAHALGEALAFEHHHRVLLVDNDAQASLTGACGIIDVEKGLAEALAGEIPLRDVMLDLASTVTLIPADLALTSLAMRAGGAAPRSQMLKDALASVHEDFDVTLIDCSPNLDILTLNALAAADAVLIPTQPQSIDLRGLRVFLQVVEQIQQTLNPELEMIGVLVTFYDQRLNHHRAAVQAMLAAQIPILEIKIGRSIRVAEAAILGRSIISTDSRHPQAQNYRDLAKLVDQWLAQA